MTIDDLIESHVRIHCAMIAAMGQEPTIRDSHTCRESLRAIVRLAQSDKMLTIAQDMVDAFAAVKH